MPAKGGHVDRVFRRMNYLQDPGRYLVLMVPGLHLHSYTCAPASEAVLMTAPEALYGVKVIVPPEISVMPVAVTVTTPASLVSTLATYLDVCEELSQPQPLAATDVPVGML